MGVASGCGYKEVYRFPHTTYPYSSCICSFLQQHPFVIFLKYIFRSLYNNYTMNHICIAILIASEASFLVRSMALNFAIYIFQVDRHSLNVLNVSMCI